MIKVALFGNPNTGKSSLFNVLTGLRQHIGNFPGVTVDVKQGSFERGDEKYLLYDFPGTYSLYPKSNEEKLVLDVLKDPSARAYPDVAVVVVDVANLERNLLLLDQVNDLQFPIVCALNMGDVAKKKGIEVDQAVLESMYPNIVFTSINARIGLGKVRLVDAIEKAQNLPPKTRSNVFLTEESEQIQDIQNRRKKIGERIHEVLTAVEEKPKKVPALDKLLIHPVWGYLFFVVVLLVIFQSVFSLAAYPMDWIEGGMAALADMTKSALPSGLVADMLADGLIAGIGGVLVFVPQIVLLFFFLGLLEETGYLSRVIFLMDRLVRPFGLNGRSVVPLMSSWACAVPGIMAARTIGNWKERMITIFVAPLMSCSARIPVYTILIALVIPNDSFLGVFNLQGLALLALYLLGLVSALFLAWIMKFFIKNREKSFLVLEMPKYKSPHWPNVFTTVFNKTKGFVWDAGKIILAFSIILWAAATFGPKGEVSELTVQDANGIQLEGADLASAQLEESFLGKFGQTIEPAIRPLGYDWKIGIALLSSFAAREVFVGSLATIYSVENGEEDTATLKEKMKAQRYADGSKVFTFAAGMSLMVFYVYALQCMATVAVVQKETKSWKWAVLQVVAMGLWAYIMAFITFKLLQ